MKSLFILLTFVTIVRSDDGYQQQQPARYNFEWSVLDHYFGNDYGQNEERYDQNTHGSYYVLLPDGRTQTVTYAVDGYGGYQADVSYNGEAKQYQPVAAASYQRPQYHSAPELASQSVVNPSYQSKPPLKEFRPSQPHVSPGLVNRKRPGHIFPENFFENAEPFFKQQFDEPVSLGKYQSEPVFNDYRRPVEVQRPSEISGNFYQESQKSSGGYAEPNYRPAITNRYQDTNRPSYVTIPDLSYQQPTPVYHESNPHEPTRESYQTDTLNKANVYNSKSPEPLPYQQPSSGYHEPDQDPYQADVSNNANVHNSIIGYQASKSPEPLSYQHSIPGYHEPARESYQTDGGHSNLLNSIGQKTPVNSYHQTNSEYVAVPATRDSYEVANVHNSISQKTPTDSYHQPSLGYQEPARESYQPVNNIHDSIGHKAPPHESTKTTYYTPKVIHQSESKTYESNGKEAGQHITVSHYLPPSDSKVIYEDSKPQGKYVEKVGLSKVSRF